MSESTEKYKIDFKPLDENQFHYNELRLLSINQARKILHIKHDDMKKLVISGKIRYVNIEGKIKIPYFELKEFLQNNLIRNRFSEDKDSRDIKDEINDIINKYKKKYRNKISRAN